jgi:hypothetical protein
MHVDWLEVAENLPEGQSMHRLEPAELRNVPGRQAAHEAAPTLGPNRPEVQLEHVVGPAVPADMLATEKEPISHRLQEEAPRVLT